MLITRYYIIFIVLFSKAIECGIFDDDEDEEKDEYDFKRLELSVRQSVVTRWRSSKEFHCLGTILTSRTVLTSCKCIGTFSLVGQLYEFKEFDSSELVMESIGDSYTFNIKRNLVHNHCRPSKWDTKLNVFDLGGWVIKESFDMSVFRIAYTPGESKENKDSDFFRHELHSCTLPYLPSMSKLRTSNLTFGVSNDCIRDYCFSRILHSSDCYEVRSSMVLDSEMCVYSTLPLDPLLVRGSSLSCLTNSSNERVFLFGTVVDSSFRYIIFSRLDNEENMNYVKKIDQSCQTSNRISSFLSAFILTFSLLRIMI